MLRRLTVLVLAGLTMLGVGGMAWSTSSTDRSAAPSASLASSAGELDFASILGVEGASGATAVGENAVAVWGYAERGEGIPKSRAGLVDIGRIALQRLQVPGIVDVMCGTSGELDLDGEPELLLLGYLKWASTENPKSSAVALAWNLDRPLLGPAVLEQDTNRIDLVPSPGDMVLAAASGSIQEFTMEPRGRLAIARVIDSPEPPPGWWFVYRCMWHGDLDGDDHAEVVLGGYASSSDGWRALLYICHEDGSLGRHCILPFQCVVQDLGAVGDGPGTALVAAVGYPISHEESLTRGLLKVLRVDSNHAVSIVCDAPAPFNSQLSWASLASLENGEVAVAWVAGKLPSTWPDGGMQEYKYTQLCAYRLAGGGLICTGSRRLEARCELLGSLPAPANVADRSGPRLLLWMFPPTVDGGKTPPVYSTSPLPFGPRGIYVLARRGPEAQPLILTLEPQLRGNTR